MGGGFGGLAAARALKHAHAQVDLIDKTNHHVFQPLLYQVATGILSPEHIAAPLRRVLGKQRNTIVLKETVIAVDAEKKLCVVEGVMAGAPVSLPYDYLVLATGVQTSYFGNNDYIPFAPGLKTIADADHLRNTILGAFENCQRTPDPKAHPELLTFVIVGAGPTGVELAEQSRNWRARPSPPNSGGSTRPRSGFSSWGPIPASCQRSTNLSGPP